MRHSAWSSRTPHMPWRAGRRPLGGQARRGSHEPCIVVSCCQAAAGPVRRHVLSRSRVCASSARPCSTAPGPRGWLTLTWGTCVRACTEAAHFRWGSLPSGVPKVRLGFQGLVGCSRSSGFGVLRGDAPTVVGLPLAGRHLHVGRSRGGGGCRRRPSLRLAGHRHR